MNASTASARALAVELLRLGLRHVVICPGSRSAPLTYAFAELARQGLVETSVRIDERDAGFLALGLAKGLRAEGSGDGLVAVVTTSGTAVANLHPAVLEASYSHVPLLLLTADRPARLRATGANQTIDDQSRVLTDVRAGIDVEVGGDAPNAARVAAEAALGSGFAGTVAGGSVGEPAGGALGPGALAGTPGPVQLNIQFDVPLVPERVDFPWTPAESEAAPVQAPAPLDPRLGEALHRLDPTSTVVLAGDDFGLGQRRVGELATRLGLPVLAEPTAPLFVHQHAVARHTEVLAGAPTLRTRIATVVVAGKPTLFRPDAKLLADPAVTLVHVQADLDRVDDAAWAELALGLGDVRGPDVPSPDAPGAAPWLAEWLEAGRALAAQDEGAGHDSAVAVGSTAAGAGGAGQPSGPAALIAPVLRAEGHVLLASSSVVRYADRITDRHARISASRGLAGIDGLVSTAVGMARVLAGPKPGAASAPAPVRLLIGDLALLHDAGGLLRMTGEARASLQIFVLNDDGGRIFAGLEHGQDYLAPYFGPYFATPHGRGFAHLAAEYDWHYESLDGPAAVSRVVAEARPGLYEIPLPPVLS
ncbi:thiamine pyrophosphate-binding protein [Brevibacterium sp. 50QC2O2]|uniref:thiamine pyrophosphate-binding protein n=1 Tax=Brevibacterium sp. 50QC2O2 TaxID=2968459 RepID=UPI00211C4FEA|nr:thiamine pyrophosphate-binding protein [Brevibacterium sp. 50QC2O2]MCQ9389199.1 thiamine pyrophosphate-binding protein [Brevibacterium sp. 50QC2O2]